MFDEKYLNKILEANKPQPTRSPQTHQPIIAPHTEL